MRLQGDVIILYSITHVNKAARDRIKVYDRYTPARFAVRK
jgi:hypothetical protein